MRGLHRQALRAAALACALGPLALGAGCGPEDDSSAAGEPELLGERPGRLTCTEWNAGTPEQRRGTIDQLTLLAGANANPEEVGPNRTLSDEDAYEALDTTCSRNLARGFLLYEIYNRAAAFSFEES